MYFLFVKSSKTRELGDETKVLAMKEVAGDKVFVSDDFRSAAEQIKKLC